MKLRDIEKSAILERLKEKAFNRTHTAKSLGIGVRTLQRKLISYGWKDLGKTDFYTKGLQQSSTFDTVTNTTEFMGVPCEEKQQSF